MNLSADDKARFAAQFGDPNLDMKDLEQIWGHSSGTLYRWGFELGVSRPKRKGETRVLLEQARQYCEAVSRELSPAELSLPALTIHKGKPIDLILFLSDLHAGRLTRSFNRNVLVARLDGLAGRLIDRIKLLEKTYSINKLHIFALGDFVVGEQVGRNVTLEELEDMVLAQVYGVCVPHLVRFTMRLLFVPITVNAVRGNHGVVVKGGASKAANWDTVTYLAWQARTSGIDEARLKFYPPSFTWFDYSIVRNTTWLLVHGDQFPVGGGAPYNGIKTRVDRWHNSMPQPFDYVAAAHLHHLSQICETWLNGALLTDDDWAREVLGREGDCAQWLLGVTDEGVEYASPIWLQDITA